MGDPNGPRGPAGCLLRRAARPDAGPAGPPGRGRLRPAGNTRRALPARDLANSRRASHRQRSSARRGARSAASRADARHQPKRPASASCERSGRVAAQSDVRAEGRHGHELAAVGVRTPGHRPDVRAWRRRAAVADARRGQTGRRRTDRPAARRAHEPVVYPASAAGVFAASAERAAASRARSAAS